MEFNQGVINNDVENSLGSLPGFDKQIYSKDKPTANKIVEIMGVNTIDTHCNIISGAKDNGKDTDILCTFIPTETTGYMIINSPTNILSKFNE